MPALIDITGQRFGRLVAIKIADRDSRGQLRWLCYCDCDGAIITRASHLKSGETRSCGCLRIGRITHGESRTRLYKCWLGMGDRAGKRQYYWHVRIDPAWRDFAAFRDWALANGYRDDLTIDRINNAAGYSPENCHWTTRREQALNRGMARAVIRSDGKRYEYIVDAAADVNGNSGHIVDVCKGRRKSASGFHWRYV